MPSCLPIMTRMENDCAWSTMGRTKRREVRVLYLLPRWPSLSLPLCPEDWALSEIHHNALLFPSSPSQNNTCEQTHILIKNELQLDVNHIQIAVAEIRGKNEITYAKTQIVHNLRPHMRNAIFRWHTLQASFEEDLVMIRFLIKNKPFQATLFSSTSRSTHTILLWTKSKRHFLFSFLHYFMSIQRTICDDN